MKKVQKTYTVEFKREAVPLAQTSGKPMAQVARELGIPDTSIHQWRKELDAHGDEAFPGSGHQPAQEEELLHHSDRGSQSTSLAYQTVLAQFQIQVSMSGKGDCYDNAMMASFFSSLKAECVNRQVYQSRVEARQSIFEWMDVFYNRQRRHSSLAYLSPVPMSNRARMFSDSTKVTLF